MNEYFEEKRNKWIEEKWAKFSASRIKELLPTKKKFYETSYFEQIISESLTEIEHSDISFVKQIRDGSDREPIAFSYINHVLNNVFKEKTAYRIEYFGVSDPVFYPHPDFGDHAGSSPDSLVFIEEVPVILIEIKCPQKETMTRYIKSLSLWAGDISEWVKENLEDYYFQIQMGMICTKTDKAILALFNEQFKNDNHKLLLIEVKKDIPVQLEINSRLSEAIAEKGKQIEKLNKFELYGNNR